ncbi:MAG: HlyC/CorC family transporter [Pseudomonadota bacterium]
MYNEIIFYGLTIFLFLLISALFSAAETALTAVSRARIYQLVMDGNKRAQIVSRLRKNKESMIGTVLLCNNAVNIAASAIATTLSVRLFGDENGLVIVTVIMTLLVVIFSEVLPKTYAIQNAERVSLIFAKPLLFLIKLFKPITYTIQLLIRTMLRLFGIDINKTNTLISSTDVIRGTIELHHREGKMIKQDRDMLGSILDLNDIEVEDIMVHRMEVETLDADLPPDDLVRMAVSTMHSRIPLWQGEPDNIIGVLHVKNLIKIIREQNNSLTTEAIVSICSKPWFIPETTSLRSQLLAFRSKRQHFAFVVDEYGGWQGIVTLEDIIEEIVGDIDDEHDEVENEIQKLGEDSYLINGSVTLRDLNRHLGWNLPDDNASTIAGLLIHEVQEIPSIGEVHALYGFDCTVVGKSAMQITRVKMSKRPETKLQSDIEL